MRKQYESVIGLEIHVELSTATKIFCACSTGFGAKPNAHTCPVCTGMPGTLPVLNRKVLEYAIALGLALGCEINPFSRFDRKNYFYPDNPQNYQISQLYEPICRGGGLEITTQEGSRRIGITEIHMEEDAGKLTHDEATGQSLVDYNRAGVPLLEIVTEPDLRNAGEVIAFLEKLRLMIQYLGISDCKLQQGSMRVDVNQSLREVGSELLGTRTEMKNLGSFRAITRAIEGEGERQRALLESGESVIQETRRWDEDKNTSFSMRSKEDAKDYRYFPDPDLPPVAVTPELLERIANTLPEFREEKMQRYRDSFALPDYDIEILTGSKAIADLFEETIALGAEPKQVSNWLMGEGLRLLRVREKDPEEIVFTPADLAKLIQLTGEKKISLTSAKEVFEVMFDTGINPGEYVREKGLLIQRDEEGLKKVILEVLAENGQSVADYKNGKDRAFGFLVGQTMRRMKGKADPAEVNRLLAEFLQ